MNTVPSAANGPGIFLGYLARKPWKPEPHWDPEGKTGVIEACSVSDCMCERTPNWVQRWDFNRATCYETVEAARDAIPPGESDSYTIFAYWLVAFDGSLVLSPDDPARLDRPVRRHRTPEAP